MNVPQLRFREFSGKWEEKKLEDVANIIDPHPSHRAPAVTLDGIPFIGIGDIKENGELDYSNVRLVSNVIYKEHRDRYTLQKGDFAFGRVASIGKVVDLSNNIEKLYTYSPTMAIIKPQLINSQYLQSYTKSEYFIRLVQDKTTGSTRKSIGMQNLRLLKISFPSKPEQQKIASFLTSVDTKIEQLTSKAKLLQEYKKGVMQKIFSQEIRFRDDDGSEYPEWVEKKIGELPIYISDGNYGELYPTSEDFKLDGIPFLRANNIKNLKIDDSDTKYISEEQHSILTSGHLLANDILITTRGDVGNIALIDNKHNGSNINAQICLLRISDTTKISYLYLLYALDYKDSKKQYKAFETGTALKQLPKGNLRKVKLKVPSLEEQVKIANLLSSIDSKIEQTKKQLDSTKEFKKALLQQMFV